MKGLLILGAFITTATLASPSYSNGTEMTVVHGGLKRIVWIHDGRTDTAKPAPAILALHGHRNRKRARLIRNAPETLGWPRLETLAGEKGFVAIFPAAYQGQWSLVPGLRNAEYDDGESIDDQAFLLDLIQQLQDEGIVDPDRTYITGISDGAIMTYRLICLSDTPFAAAAALIGTAHEDHIADCTPTPPPALMHLHGDNDSVLPYEGWIFKSGREVSVPEVMNHWRRLHGCTGQKGKLLEDIDPDDGSKVSLIDWTGCVTGPYVRRYKVKGGGHSVPATGVAQSTDPKRKRNRDLDTMAEVWQFVSAVSRSSLLRQSN